MVKIHDCKCSGSRLLSTKLIRQSYQRQQSFKVPQHFLPFSAANFRIIKIKQRKAVSEHHKTDEKKCTTYIQEQALSPYHKVIELSHSLPFLSLMWQLKGKVPKYGQSLEHTLVLLEPQKYLPSTLWLCLNLKQSLSQPTWKIVINDLWDFICMIKQTFKIFCLVFSPH